jgi:hypothetical protein
MVERSVKSEEVDSNENVVSENREQSLDGKFEPPPFHGTEELVQDDESSRLRKLDANVRNQDDLERDIGLQARTFR